MLNKDSQISLTYELGGEYLLRRGQYTSADVYVKNPLSKNETFKLNKLSKTIKRAEYAKAVQQVTLSNAFVRMALDKPEKPDGMSFKRWMRTPMGKLYLNFKKMSAGEKIAYYIEQYVADMGGGNYSYKIL